LELAAFGARYFRGGGGPFWGKKIGFKIWKKKAFFLKKKTKNF